MNAMDAIMESKVRIKIILVLSELEEISVTQLAKAIGSNYALTLKHVKALEELGIVKEVNIGRMRIVKLNKHSEAYSHIKNLVNALRGLSSIKGGEEGGGVKS